MLSAPRPDDEARRLSVLYALGILDTPPETRFDEITAAGRHLCDAPICLLTLIDDHRQWFKSRMGLDVRETPREVAFGAHTILRDELLIVPDTRADTRFYDNPLVTGNPRIRFYAGYPLHAPTGEHLGALCVIDTKPRPAEMPGIRALISLGRRAELQLWNSGKVEIDSVSRIPNRAMFLKMGGLALKRQKAHSSGPLTLFVYQLSPSEHEIDLSVRGISDRGIRDFVSILRQAHGELALFGRIGLNTFTVLAPNAAESPEREEWSQGSHVGSATRFVRNYPPLSIILDIGYVQTEDDNNESIDELLIAGCGEALLARKLRTTVSSSAAYAAADAALLHSLLSNSRTLGDAFPVVQWEGESSRPDSARIRLQTSRNDPASIAVTPAVLMVYLTSSRQFQKSIASRINEIIDGAAGDDIGTRLFTLEDLEDLLRMNPGRIEKE